MQSSKKRPLALGSFSPASQIRVRVWSFNTEDSIDGAFFQRIIQSCWEQKASILGTNWNNHSFRIVNGENDGIPGFIADYYEGYVSIQINATGAEFFKEKIIKALVKVIKPKAIINRSDTSSRKKEGLKKVTEWLYGNKPENELIINENGYQILVDLEAGHKTGFYLDQTENRNIVKGFVQNKSVLNCFSYTGGFTVASAIGGAKEITEVDTSEEVLKLSQKNQTLNHISPSLCSSVKGDVFQFLRKAVGQNQKYDVIILDPPKFIDSKSSFNKGCRGYKDINLLAFQLLNPGGLLFTFSCSGLMTRDLFQKIVFDAALDAGQNAKILKHLSQNFCHSVGLNFPEGLYLKGLLCQIN